MQRPDGNPSGRCASWRPLALRAAGCGSCLTVARSRARGSLLRLLPPAVAGYAGLGALALALGLLDPQLIVDVFDAGDRLEGVLGHALGLSAFDGAGQCYLALLDLHLDVLGIELAVLGQPLADVLLDALVIALVTARATTAVRTGNQPDL